jgi:5-methylcytosine-specific restriction endonuclease McrA
MKAHKILVLNKCYFPIGVEGIEKTFGNIFSGSVTPLDISYEVDGDGNTDFESVEYFSAVKNAEEWLKLPIRSYDNFLQTSRGPVRIPEVVVCSNYDKIVFSRVQFPTKHNIYKRDNFTCVYTGQKLTKEALSIDHVIPRSKGGTDTWENLVTCDRLLNSRKGSQTLAEAKLKLRYKPYKPDNGMIFDTFKDEWSIFLKNL